MAFNILVTAVEIGASIALFHLALGLGASAVVSYLIGSIAPVVGGCMVWARARTWAAYWPEHADEPFGDVMNSMKKYVVSRSLRSADWQNTELVNGDVARKLTDIKASEGGDIAMSGSATTVRWLLREGLLDELNLLVHPLVVGDGLARLFPPDEPTTRLELRSWATFKSGVLNLSYTPAEE